MERDRGFEEIPHTADWSLRVWADDLPGLFEEAARGMYTLAAMQLGPAPRVRRHLELEAADAESLLVAFLSELLYIQEQDGVGFDTYRLELQGSKLAAELEGAPVETAGKVIKAVTFHDLKIVCSERGCETRLVFDV